MAGDYDRRRNGAGLAMEPSIPVRRLRTIFKIQNGGGTCLPYQLRRALG